MAARIFDALPDSANFEHMLHVLEQLEAFNYRTEPEPSAEVMQAAFDVHSQFGDLCEPHLVSQERYEIIEDIAAAFNVVDYDQYTLLYDLLRPLYDQYNLDYYTLNYDLLADMVVYALSWRADGAWSTGFTTTPVDQYGGNAFLPAFFAGHQGPRAYLRLAHLHGSLRFAYTLRGDEMSRNANVELAQFDGLKQASEVRRWIQAQAIGFERSLINVSPILSGLRKTEKLNVAPYGNYFADFAGRVSSSPRLLVVGYGGADPHINFWLNQYVEIHTGAAKFVEISLNDNYRNTLAYRLFGDGRPWNNPAEGRYESVAGHACVVTSGMNSAIAAHVPHIRAFFAVDQMNGG